jgi:hypothetical protein
VIPFGFWAQSISVRQSSAISSIVLSRSTDTLAVVLFNSWVSMLFMLAVVEACDDIVFDFSIDSERVVVTREC